MNEIRVLLASFEDYKASVFLAPNAASGGEVGQEETNHRHEEAPGSTGGGRGHSEREEPRGRSETPGAGRTA